ncbi:MAG: hypothetical protein IJ691_06485 [Lachnospiraceae bacterium]|nr:hypothetical protein [Lachnospiraceae bacterium]
MALFDSINLVIQVVLLMFVIVASVRLLKRGNNIFLTILFLFSIVSWLLSDLYWLAFDVLRSGEHMPLAANELGECAMFLLLSTAISKYKNKEEKISVFAALFASIFTVANTALWIIWSGEWLQDIVCGISLFGLLSTFLQICEEKKMLKAYVKVVMSLTGFFVILFQAFSTYWHNIFTRILEDISYMIIFAAVLFFIVLAVSYMRRKVKTKPFLYSIAALLCTVFGIYMSPGIVYSVIFALTSVVGILMFLTIRREVLPDDIR